MPYHQFHSFEKITTEELQIDTNIELSERINLIIKQNISLALLYFSMPNNLRRLLLYAILNFS